MLQPLSDTRPEDFAACKAKLRKGSRSFAAASLLLPRRVREPAAALYAFCRMADDAIDLSADPGAVAALRERLERIYQGTPADSPIDRAFARVAAERDLPRALVDALIDGFAWDAEGRRYTSISELCAYAARVAGTVGALMTALMGPRDADTMARACDLGVAMQLTNIARDVGEDARAGRLYLPLSWLEEAGVDPAAFLRKPRPGNGVGGVIERLLRFADGLYIRADQGIAMLPRDCQPAIRAARLIYADIGREIVRADFDSISRRAVVSGRRKLWLVLRALFSRASEQQRGTSIAPPLPETAFLVSAAARSPGVSPPAQLGEAAT
jgi:15-cis-phytoene synthase